MTALERLERYLVRQRAAFAAYARLSEKIGESIRGAAADALAAQALEERRLVEGMAALQRAIAALRELCGGEAAALAGLEAALERERLESLEKSRRNRYLLRDALQELRLRLRALGGRPRSSASPFMKIGQASLVDIRS